MKALVISLGMLMSFSLAGELAALHQKLAQPENQAQLEQDCPQVKTPGVTALPGACAGTKPEPEISAIGLERGPCYANCPVYTVIFQADGSFRYTGESNVERMGEHTGQVSEGLLRQLFYFIEEMDFMGLRDSYTSPFLDNAATYVMVEKPDQTKVIENYANSGPASLWALERLIDGVLETAEWDSTDR